MRLFGKDYYVKGPSLQSLRISGRWQFSGMFEHYRSWILYHKFILKLEKTDGLGCQLDKLLKLQHSSCVREEQPWWESEQFLAPLGGGNRPFGAPAVPVGHWRASAQGQPPHTFLIRALPPSQPKHSPGLTALCLDHPHPHKEAWHTGAFHWFQQDLMWTESTTPTMEQRWG